MKSWLLAAGLLASSSVLFADGLTFTVSPVVEFSPQGGTFDPTCQTGSLTCVIFSSIITPDDTNDYNLTAVNIAFLTSPSTGLSLNPTFFETLGPPFILAGNPSDSTTWFVGPTFEIDVAPSTAPGTYTGIATLIGGTDPDPTLDTATLGSSPFTIVVTPEPALGWVAGLLLAGLALRGRLRRGVPRW